MIPSRKTFDKLPGKLLRPVPTMVYQPIAQRLTRRVAHNHPELYSRLGEHAYKRFLIVPTNLPFVVLLQPDPHNPRSRVYRNEQCLSYDASIRGSALSLLRMMDGESDGDALFFSRDLKVEGDTEAVVSLRNALDDIEGSIANDFASMFGKPGRATLSFLRRAEI